MAIIQDEDVGNQCRAALNITIGHQSIRNSTRVVDLHLTAERFYVKLTALLHAADISLSHCWRPRMRSDRENPEEKWAFRHTARTAFTQNPRGLRPEYRYRPPRGHGAIAAPAAKSVECFLPNLNGSTLRRQPRSRRSTSAVAPSS